MVERVTSFKLLGLTIANNLNWEEYARKLIDGYTSWKKRWSVSDDDLLHCMAMAVVVNLLIFRINKLTNQQLAQQNSRR